MIIVSQDKMTMSPLDSVILIKEKNLRGSDNLHPYDVIIETEWTFHVLGSYDTEEEAKAVLETIANTRENNWPVYRMPSIEELKRYKNKPKDINSTNQQKTSEGGNE